MGNGWFRGEEWRKGGKGERQLFRPKTGWTPLLRKVVVGKWILKQARMAFPKDVPPMRVWVGESPLAGSSAFILLVLDMADEPTSCLAEGGGWGNWGISGAEEAGKARADGVHCRKTSPREIYGNEEINHEVKRQTSPIIKQVEEIEI